MGSLIAYSMLLGVGCKHTLACLRVHQGVSVAHDTKTSCMAFALTFCIFLLLSPILMSDLVHDTPKKYSGNSCIVCVNLINDYHFKRVEKYPNLQSLLLKYGGLRVVSGTVCRNCCRRVRREKLRIFCNFSREVRVILSMDAIFFVWVFPLSNELKID